jgi:hypothetical protein
VLPSVPKVAAGVYSVWENGRLIYVGMSGRGLAAEDIDAPDEPVKAKGLWTRLDSHASGRKSGDQFCVYICDRSSCHASPRSSKPKSVMASCHLMCSPGSTSASISNTDTSPLGTARTRWR